MKLSDFFEVHYKPKRLHGKSKNTVRLYEVCFRNLARTLGREPLLSDLTNESIAAHMQRMLDDGRTKATANKERCQLVALWRYASRIRMLEGWPDVPKEQEPTRVPMAWTREDVDKLLQACAKLDGTIKGSDIPNWLWWTTLVRIMLDTGERVTAVTSAKWSWIETDSILIPAESRKGGKRDKWFALSPQTMLYVSQLRKSSSGDGLFHWPYCSTYLWNRYQRILVSAGLPTGRKSSTHRLRKTHASVGFAAGLDPQELLDHTDRRTTQRYLDPRFARQTQPSKIIADWLRNPPKPLLRKTSG